MARPFFRLCVHVLLLSTFLQTRQVRCLRRLTPEADEIRSILSSALSSKPSQTLANNGKRDTSREDLASVDSSAGGDVRSESRDDAIYEDEVEDDDTGQQGDPDESEYKRSVDSNPSGDSSADQVDLDAYDESDVREVKDVAKRETKDEVDYDEDLKADASLSADNKISEVQARSTDAEKPEDLEKVENRRDAPADEVNADLNFEKQIEDQIQQRIDSIKEDIKREIERKQQVREIEANNAKYDELVLNREDNDDSDDLNEVVEVGNADASKRSLPRDAEKSSASLRSKRSDLGGFVGNEVEKSAAAAPALPVKKRSLERRVTLVEKKRDLRGGRRKDRSSMLIPERGHAEVKDELPADLTLGADLRLARSESAATSRDSRSARSENAATSRDSRSARSENAATSRDSRSARSENAATSRDSRPARSENVAASDDSARSARSENAAASGDSARSARSVANHADEAPRYRRDMADEAENEEGQEGNFLFAPREKPECRMRRRRSRGRDKARKHPARHSRRHRAIRESSVDDEELEDERDKRAMSLDEDAALEYKESFGGFQSDTSGRFKRIRRSAKVS